MKGYIMNVAKFCQYCDERKLTVKTFATESGVSTSAIYGWLSGKASPNYTTIKRIRNVMGIDLNTCLERSKKHGRASDAQR